MSPESHSSRLGAKPIRYESWIKILLLMGGIFLSGSLSAQQERSWLRRTAETVFNDTSTSGDAKFIAYPTVAYAPETRWEFGASALYVYYAKGDAKNRLSEVRAFTFFTLEQQYGFWLKHELYTDQSKWFFLGKGRLEEFPLLYYGIGSETPAVETAQVDGLGIYLRERVLRKIKHSLYLGLEFDLSRLTKVGFQAHEEGTFAFPTGSEGSTNLGLGLGLVYDDRHNVLNVRKGFFGELGFLNYDGAWGSDFSFNSYFLDFRYFHSTTKDQVWASQIVANVMEPHTTESVPFNQLALMGGEETMRGYYLGRYRDNVMMAAQTEYRFLPFPFSRRFGGAAFLGVGGVSPSVRKIDLGDWVVAGGGGVRFLLFPGKDIFTRFDVAFTTEGVGYYFFIGEAF